jgi:hypothetical protein
VNLSASASVQQNPYGTNLILGFLWYQNGTNLVSTQAAAGTNQTATLNLPSVSSANAGTYTVVVTNYWGSTTSSSAVVAVSAPPVINNPPASKGALVGQNTTFSVTASGAGPLSYQWQKNSVDISNGGVFSGVNNSVLSLQGLSQGEAGSYSVIVTNSSGSATSSAAVLTVGTPPSLNMSFVPPNSVTITGNTVNGLTYVVEKAINLSPPVQWTPIATNVANSGAIGVTNSTTSTEQYFRLSFP